MYSKTHIRIIFFVFFILKITGVTAKNNIDPAVNAFLNNPYAIFQKDKIDKGFRIIVLSNLSEYFYNIYKSKIITNTEAQQYLKKIYDIATNESVSPFLKQNINTVQLKDHGLYLSHLNIILGFHKLATNTNTYSELNKRISQHLHNLSVKDSTYHIASFAGSSLRFPADQSATLFSLHLFDKNYATQLSKQPISKWLFYIHKKGTNKKYNLPFSEISGKTNSSSLPRGCALSFTIRYLAAFNKDEAKKLWNAYKKEYLMDIMTYAGFREWPKGIEKKADVDSGPIVMGMGGAATGLGLIASKVMKDDVLYKKIKNTEQLVNSDTKNTVTQSILAVSIRLVATTYTGKEY